jgi:uncharacterized delta-60 repeat protein
MTKSKIPPKAGKLFFFVILVLVSIPAFAQVDTAWVRRYPGPYGDDYAYAIAVDGAGNVYVTGASRGPGAGYINDYATVKYDSLGNEQWVARYNGHPTTNYPDEARAIAVDENGVYVTGYTRNRVVEDSSDYCTIKYDKTTGDTIWVRKYNGTASLCDEPYALVIDANGNVYVTGRSKGTDTGFDFLTIKYSSDGESLWTARYNTYENGWDMAYAIAVDINGNVYVTGSSYDLTTYYDCATIKYNSSGVQQWARRYSYEGNQSDEGKAITVDDAGNVYVTGRSVSTTTSWDYITIKYNAGGTQQWPARYNGTGNYDDGPTGIVVDPSGNVYVTGRSGIAPFYYQYATVKYSPLGAQRWVRTYLGPGCISSEANDIAIDNQNNIYVTGQSYDTASVTYYDYATVKYDSAGVQKWVARYNGPADNSDLATSIAVDGQSKVYITGYSTGSGTDYDYATIKYFQFLRGDANGDGVINVTDVVYLINYLFLVPPGPAPIPPEAGDVNCDGVINITDVVYLINFLFLVPPGPPPGC